MIFTGLFYIKINPLDVISLQTNTKDLQFAQVILERQKYFVVNALILAVAGGYGNCMMDPHLLSVAEEAKPPSKLLLLHS